jgi:hypothetical protein
VNPGWFLGPGTVLPILGKRYWDYGRLAASSGRFAGSTRRLSGCSRVSTGGS